MYVLLFTFIFGYSNAKVIEISQDLTTDTVSGIVTAGEWGTWGHLLRTLVKIDPEISTKPMRNDQTSV